MIFAPAGETIKRVEMSEGKRMVQIITDSSALITPAEGKAMGVEVIPLCVSILDEEYRDLQVNMDYFYGQICQRRYSQKLTAAAG